MIRSAASHGAMGCPPQSLYSKRWQSCLTPWCMPGFQVNETAGKDVLELFNDLEEYIGEAIYSLAKQGTDQSMAETIRQFITTQAGILLIRGTSHPLMYRCVFQT